MLRCSVRAPFFLFGRKKAGGEGEKRLTSTLKQNHRRFSLCYETSLLLENDIVTESGSGHDEQWIPVSGWNTYALETVSERESLVLKQDRGMISSSSSSSCSWTMSLTLLFVSCVRDSSCKYRYHSR